MDSLRLKVLSIVGTSGLVDDPLSVSAHNTDWRGRYHGSAPWGVQPATTEEVIRVVKACAAAGVHIVPQGGNTSQCGAATPRSTGEIFLSLSRMNRIHDIDHANATLTCDSGVILANIQSAAKAAGFLFPLSLASEGTAQIGGVISTNAGGTAVLRYGNMRALVLGMEVVLADGRCWNGLHGLRKDNTGYDLKQWFIGAEGTLGIITRAVLRLFPLPRQRVTAWLEVTDPAAAVALLRHLYRDCGDRISGFELVSQTALALVVQHLPQCRPPLGKISPWSILLELEESEAQAPLQVMVENSLHKASAESWVTDGVIAHNEQQASEFWGLRELISEAQKREGISIKHDISVPVSRIPEFIERASAQLEQAFPGLRIVCFGHVGDGNLHYNLSYANSLKNAEFIPQTALVNRIVHDVVAQLQGSISAEHGIGQLKVKELQRYKDPVGLALMRQIKQTLDPTGLFNPGKVLDPDYLT
ncbi:MAG: FAD-binding oxidoreductase [Ferrovum sp.]|nr:FAD-binding oxidoreductase [Ferrovum sp.]NDU86811.1 FAD-binding oxidoreductase [Ferrovum sp.]